MDGLATSAAPSPLVCVTRRLHVLEQQLNPQQQPAAAVIQHDTLHACQAAADGQQADPARVSSRVGAVQQCPCSSREGQQQNFLDRFLPPCQDVCTLHDNWEMAIARYPAVPALGWRSRDTAGELGPYKWWTYSEVGAVRTAIGAGLLQLGISSGSAVGLYSVNCKEWVLLDAAAHAYSMATVPLYDSLGPDAVQYIINHAELAVVGCSTTVLPKLLACLPQCPSVKLLVTWDAMHQGHQQPWLQSQSQSQYGTKSDTRSGTTSDTCAEIASDTKLPTRVSVQFAQDLPCRVVTLGELEALGRGFPLPHVSPSARDVATICYTSGTTGPPKGAVLTHANLIANAAGCAAAMQSLAWAPGDKHLSFLPLAHIFERKNLTVSVHFGCSVGFYSGDARGVFQDAAVLQPDMFMAVPRVYSRLYEAVMEEVRGWSPLRRRLFDQAYAYKAAAIEAGDLSGGLIASVLDRLLFDKIKHRLGGKVRYMTSGSSPLSPQLLTFLRVCFGADVLEGYGMTEAACTISIARQGDASTGHVGLPLDCCQVKLVDIPDMGYCSSDTPYPRGEVCVRGPSVFQGYHKSPEQTAAVLDAGGWLHTGDVGQWLPGNRLQLIDRKKNLFKLAQGEYVSPEKLETIYARSQFVSQVFVHGDSMQHQVVAVAVPDPDVLLPWALERGFQQGLAALCVHPVVVQAVLTSMVQQAKEAQVQGYEVPAAVWLVPTPFSVEAGLLTPTMKLRRHAARQQFRAAIDAMYAQLQQLHTAQRSSADC